MRERIINVLTDFNEEITEDMDRDILAAEILDSFDMVQLVVAIEEEFDIVVDVELITPENFQTANMIVETIAGILG